MKELAVDSQVFVMDRRGIGYSGGGGGVRTPDQNVSDLRKVLELKGVAPPYVPVGHSLGGHNIRLFESLYPEEVVGMVLVDALNTDHLTSSADGPSFFLECVASTGRFGSTRLIDLFIRPKTPQADGIDADRIAGTASQGGYARAVLNHWYGADSGWEERRSKLHTTINVPLTIIAAKGPPIGGLRWRQGQEELRKISRNAKFIDTNRHHALHLRQPSLVIQEIKDMLNLCASSPEPPHADAISP